MSTVFIKTPNILLFNVRVEFFYIDKDNFIPFERCKVDDLLETLNSFNIETITAEYNTTGTDKVRKRDLEKYTKRLQELGSDWDFTPWDNKKVGGYVMHNIFQSVLTKRREC